MPLSLVKLRDECRRLQRAVSGSPIGIAFESPFTARDWLSDCAHRSTMRHGDESSEACGDCTGREQRIIRFEPSGIGPCQIYLCSPDSTSRTALDCIEELVKAIVEIHEFSEREQPLFRELAASWETIEALYETGLDLQSHDSLQKVTDRLLDRSVSAAPDISAMLWVLEGDHFRTVAQRRCDARPARLRSQGLLGQAHRSGVPLVVDSCTSDLVNPEVDLELHGSGPVVVIPVHTRQGLEAVFEVWRESGEQRFETPAIRLLEAIAQQITIAIENDRLYRAALEGECMAQEIQIGASIQQQLLFGSPAEKLVGGEIGQCMIPSRLASGDFYTLVRHSEVCLDVVIGDVMGKGVAAALTGAATKIALLRVLAESKGIGEANRLPEPAEIVTAANRQMSAQLEKLSSFVTLFYGRFDFEKRTLTYVDAGHTETAHFIRETGSTDLLRGDGFPLGFSASETYRQSTIQLGAGDIVLAYSDGLTEATDGQGTPYETRRIVSYLTQHASLSASEITRAIAEDLKAYRCAAEPDDDLTFLVIKLGGKLEEAAVSPTYRYVMVARLDQLEGLRGWLADTLRAGACDPIGDEALFRLQLALQEAATNVICHGIKPELSQEISVVAQFEGSKLQLTIAYEGGTFSRESAPAPSFDGSCDHGFGLFLIDQLMDEVTYSLTVGHNNIRLSKELEGSQEQQP